VKSCPTCNRTFEDTFTFCLVDGAILSAPFDPHATLTIPEQRQTELPPTEVLHPQEKTKEELPPAIASPQPEKNSHELVSTIAAPAPAFESPQIKASPVQPASMLSEAHGQDKVTRCSLISLTVLTSTITNMKAPFREKR
jgi:hypothetical protein